MLSSLRLAVGLIVVSSVVTGDARAQWGMGMGWGWGW